MIARGPAGLITVGAVATHVGDWSRVSLIDHPNLPADASERSEPKEIATLPIDERLGRGATQGTPEIDAARSARPCVAEATRLVIPSWLPGIGARAENPLTGLHSIPSGRLSAGPVELGSAGDAVLCKVAAACRLTVRSSDVVARLGGDEFAILLENCAEDRAKHIGQQLLRALNPLEFEWKGSSYTIGASIGLAMNTMDMSDEKAWLESADKACYDAKRQGRGRLRIATRLQGVELPTKQG